MLRWLLAVALALCLVPAIVAQSLTTGGITGVITDPSGAVVPAATVNLKSLETGAAQDSSSNASGEYRFTLLKPGRYTITVAQTGFQRIERQVEVAVGNVVTANLALSVGQATTTVEVSAIAPLINSEPSVSTPYTPAELAQLPSAGGDITNIAFTAPGAVVNTSGGYGNFTINGLPGTSNLYTVNGENDMDPYFNTNNSGASNLTLGQNELQEATITANPYGGQFGQLAGAQVSYVTKSGSNDFHGNVAYWWNGRILNANDWFNNSYGDPRPFANANQWAASIAGPIRKNKLFFFVDNEGLRFALPNVDSITTPTPAFASAVLANVQAKQPAEFNLYQKMMNLWLNAPGAGGAMPIANTSYCNSLSLPGFNPKTQACAAKYQATPVALGSEWILSGRVDYKISDKDSAYFRHKQDRGVQPTTLDAINSNFNAISHQPSWDSQVDETHVFGPRSTNDFKATLSYYYALFQQDHQLAASTFPTAIITSSSVPFTSFNQLYNFPQGRNITQYQFIDDYTLNEGSHNLKFGVNFRRYDVSDHNFYFNSPAVYYGYVAGGLQNFANGVAYQYRQRLNAGSDVPIAMWGVGFYAHDEWAVTSNLKITLALRMERNSNPVCQFNCFANFKGPWNTLASVTSANPGTVPYSADINYNQHTAYPGMDAILPSPRVGFSWSPNKNNKTVISGGFGIFYDSPPAGLVDNFLADPPVAVDIRVRPAAGILPFDPGTTGGPAVWSASANAFNVNQTFSQISAAMKNLGAVFSAPSFTSVAGTLRAPQWQEWNIQLQRELTPTMSMTVNYVGNHGIRIPYSTGWPNAYDLYGLYPGVPGIPASPKVPNYGIVTQWQSGAVSNYNGLNISLRRQFSHWVAAHLNYTWAHNLDEGSNGGIYTTGDSLFGQINPFSLRANNYGNSDYDIRHSLNGDFVINPAYHIANRVLNGAFGGWQISGKLFWRTGLPFSVYDGNTALNGGGALLAIPLANVPAQTSCGAAAAVTPCINANAFFNTADPNFSAFTYLSPQTRNQYRGPHYFDMDMNLYKNFKLREKVNLGLGVQAFNVFNHPNFGQPDGTLGDATFGQITGMASTLTSPYGSFLGFDSSPRLFQLTGKIVF